MGPNPDDDGKNEPSLELPSLGLPGLRRRKDRKDRKDKKKKKTAEEPATEGSTTATVEPAPQSVPAAAPVEPAPPVQQVPPAADEPTTKIPMAREDTVVEPPPAARPVSTQPPTQPATQQAAHPAIPSTTKSTSQPAAPPPGPQSPFLEQSLHDQGGSTAMESPEAAADQQSPSGRSFSLPPLPGRAAALVTGLVVGVVGAVLTYLAMQGCEVVQGTSSCGRPGFFLLLAVLALMVLLGAVLLKAWQVTDPGSTSLLAVGVVSVVVLAVLIDVIFSGWMFLIVPIVSALGYALSHWVTTTFIEPANNDPTRQEAHDLDAR